MALKRLTPADIPLSDSPIMAWAMDPVSQVALMFVATPGNQVIAIDAGTGVVLASSTSRSSRAGASIRGRCRTASTECGRASFPKCPKAVRCGCLVCSDGWWLVVGGIGMGIR